MNLDQPLNLADRLEQIEQRKKDDEEVRKMNELAKETLRKAWIDLSRHHNLRVVHMPYHKQLDNGGYTIVWQPTLPGGRVVRVAVALQNPGDEYNRLIGRALAAGRFNAGQFITLHVPRAYLNDIGGYLDFMFRN